MPRGLHPAVPGWGDDQWRQVWGSRECSGPLHQGRTASRGGSGSGAASFLKTAAVTPCLGSALLLLLHPSPLRLQISPDPLTKIDCSESLASGAASASKQPC